MDMPDKKTKNIKYENYALFILFAVVIIDGIFPLPKLGVSILSVLCISVLYGSCINTYRLIHGHIHKGLVLAYLLYLAWYCYNTFHPLGSMGNIISIIATYSFLLISSKCIKGKVDTIFLLFAVLFLASYILTTFYKTPAAIIVSTIIQLCIICKMADPILYAIGMKRRTNRLEEEALHNEAENESVSLHRKLLFGHSGKPQWKQLVEQFQKDKN